VRGRQAGEDGNPKADWPRTRGPGTPTAGARHTAPADTDAAGGGMLEARDAAQRRGLAAARGAKQHHDLTGRHVKAHPVYGGPADGELLAQIADVEGSRHTSLGWTYRSCIEHPPGTADSRRSCSTPRPRTRAASRTDRSSVTRP